MRVLEVNVDDNGYSGVYSLIKNVIYKRPKNLKIDIGAYEQFEKIENLNELEKVGCRVHYIGYEGNKLLKQFICFKKLKNIIKKNQYDCVHIHSDVANKILIMGLSARVAGVKRIILHSHASDVDGNHRIFKRIFHRSCRRFLRFIGTDFVACSELASLWMFPNIQKENIMTIHNGVDLKKFQFSKKNRQKLRDSMQLNEYFVIGHVGRFSYQKNHDFLIEVFKKIMIF